MFSFNYTNNKATKDEILNHLKSCDKLFKPRLSSSVDIPVYAQKIKNNAFTFEAWQNNELVGLIACYLNDINKLQGHITNVSILKEFQGKGISKYLLEQTILKGKELGFKTLSLDVEVSNIKAISLYQKYGFIITNSIDSKYIMINRLSEDRNVIVSICCITYNHENYIEAALDGFLMQKCNFDFEIIIADDASTDNNQNIIREYQLKSPDVLKPILRKTNIGANNNFNDAVSQATGKYIALCEGDDYWTDPYKLQKQVDFLEANPKMSAVVHPSKIINVLKKIESTTERNLPVKLKYQHILSSRKFHTNSIVFKSEIMQNFITGVYSGDRAMYFLCMANGPIGFINEIMSVYRVTGTGASSTLDYKKIKTDFKIIPWIKRIDPKFPARDFRVYLYKTLYYVTYTNKSVIRFYYFMALLFAIVLSKAYNIKDFYYYIKSR